MKGRDWLPAVLTVIFFSVLFWSVIRPKEYLTWFLEVLPALIGFVLLVLTYKRFRFTPLVYWLILGHMIILMIGGHYTYSEVPLFDWLSEIFHWGRNNYDKLGHFAQGFIPAAVAREILKRNKVVNGDKWLEFIVISICLSVSGMYELFEWTMAVVLGQSAESFLATQGYVWDTQSDIALALAGAVSNTLLLSKYHYRKIKTWESREISG